MPIRLLIARPRDRILLFGGLGLASLRRWSAWSGCCGRSGSSRGSSPSHLERQPSRLYGRPRTLAADELLDPDRLVAELLDLGYREAAGGGDAARAPGSFGAAATG